MRRDSDRGTQWGKYTATSLSDRNTATLMVWARAMPLSRLGRVLIDRDW
jgi:hypothetical protein